MKRIGIFGGTFDPIHLGHLLVAIALKEAHALDHVYFLPANINPQKQNSKSASSEHRCQMIKIALRGVPGCSLLSLEVDRPGPSYMVDTLRALKTKKPFKNSELFLLLGEDQLAQFTEWKEPHEIITLCMPLIARRSHSAPQGAWQQDPELKEIILLGMTETPFFDISATDVRKRLKEGAFCGHLVNKAVLHYIHKHKVYNDN